MHEAEEKEFIRQLLDPASQQAAFRRLVSEYSRPLYRHIRHLVIDHDDTDDILQNTFVKVFRHLPTFKGESRLYTWMYRIATNEAISFLKQKSKRYKVNSEELQTRLVENLKADAYFEGDELQARLQKAVATLPEKQQLVFRMKYYQELKYEEISEILGTSVGALKASYHHAVKKIEEYFNED